MGEPIIVLGLTIEQIQLLKDFYEIHTGSDPNKITSVFDTTITPSSISWRNIDRLIKIGLEVTRITDYENS